MIGVLTRIKRVPKDTEARWTCEERELAAVLPQAKEYLRRPEAGRGTEGFSPRATEAMVLISDFWP